MTDVMTTIRTLSAGMVLLNEGDRNFARSLLDSVAKYGGRPTAKQLFWLEKLATRCTTGGADPTTIETVGDLAGVYGLFTTAKAHLKHPAIVLGYKRGHETRELRITVAGERASKPGSLNVADDADRTWFGRIHQDGTFEHSRKSPPPSGLSQVLSAFAAEPAKVAAEHGHLTGKCCFCNRALTDERSTAVGYGATCAEHYGMPWGAKAAKARAVDAALLAFDAQQVLGDVPHEEETWADTAGEEEYDRAEARAVSNAFGAF